MIYKGYKIKIRCIDWEQVKVIDQYWDLFTSYVAKEKIIGLGMNWADDYLYFDYALGVIDDEETSNKLKEIDFSKTNFNVEYTEINLPDFKEWEVFKGKDKDVKQIYENEIDCYKRLYDYELEYIDSKGNIVIKIHFINDKNA